MGGFAMPERKEVGEGEGERRSEKERGKGGRRRRGEKELGEGGGRSEEGTSPYPREEGGPLWGRVVVHAMPTTPSACVGALALLSCMTCLTVCACRHGKGDARTIAVALAVAVISASQEGS